MYVRVWDWFRNNTQLYIPVQYINRKFCFYIKFEEMLKILKISRRKIKVQIYINIDLKEIL